MNLLEALGLEHGSAPPRVALVGSGGKTTALFQLASQLLAFRYPTVFVSTTTHLCLGELTLADHVLLYSREEPLDKNKLSALKGIVLVCGEKTPDQRVKSLDENQLSDLLAIAEDNRFPLLIEADGSKRKPLKAPAEHEPAIPGFVNEIIVVAGLSGIGKVLSSDTVHREKLFSELTGVKIGEVITADALIRFFMHPKGGLKSKPPAAKITALLNQADQLYSLEIPHHIARAIQRAYKRVVIGSLQKSPDRLILHEPIAGLILAAGAAVRFDHPKQLLMWKGKPLIEWVIQTAIRGGLYPIRVVVGAYRAEVVSHLQAMTEYRECLFEIVENPDWKEGQSSSLRAGLRSLPSDTGGCIFLLADQPLIPVELVQRLQDIRAETRAWIVAPRYKGARANPVLFGRELFDRLHSIHGDSGGRSLFQEGSTFPIAWLDWDEPGIIFDVDTPEDYQRLIDGRYE